MRTPRPRRLGAWVGLIALLLHALLPAAAQAWTAYPASGTAFSDATFPAACVAHADPVPSAESDPAAPANSDAPPVSHDCALCVVHCAATAAALPAEVGRLAAPMVAGAALVAVSSDWGRARALAEATYPRGPPAA